MSNQFVFCQVHFIPYEFEAQVVVESNLFVTINYQMGWLNILVCLIFTIDVCYVSATSWTNKGNRLENSGILYEYEYLESPNGYFQLRMQPDGNLVGYYVTNDFYYYPFWNTATHGTGSGSGYYLKLQNDDNLVLYDSTNTALWSTGTGNNQYDNVHLKIQILYYIQMMVLHIGDQIHNIKQHVHIGLKDLMMIQILYMMVIIHMVVIHFLMDEIITWRVLVSLVIILIGIYIFKKNNKG